MPQPKSVLIVDDEPFARSKVKRFLSEALPVVHILEAGDGHEAMEVLENDSPDLIFLDIQMPGMTGLELVEAFGAENLPPVIFTTAYDQYAVKAFEHNAVDYLLKPFDQTRFQKAIDRFIQQSSPPQVTIELLSQLAKTQQPNDYIDRLMVRENSRLLPVKVEDIQWLEADDKYVRLHTKSGRPLIRNTITNLSKRLDPKRFVRVHRSSIVNLDQIQDLEPLTHGDYQIHLKSGAKLTLSRRYSDSIKQSFL